MADEALRDHLLALLQPLGVQSRPLFGGHGFYAGGRFFGFVSGGFVWLRTDEDSRKDYLERDMPAFQPANRPRGPRTVDRNFRVPDDVVRDDEKLYAWAVRALRVD